MKQRQYHNYVGHRFLLRASNELKSLSDRISRSFHATRLKRMTQHPQLTIIKGDHLAFASRNPSLEIRIPEPREPSQTEKIVLAADEHLGLESEGLHSNRFSFRCKVITIGMIFLLIFIFTGIGQGIIQNHNAEASKILPSTAPITFRPTISPTRGTRVTQLPTSSPTFSLPTFSPTNQPTKALTNKPTKFPTNFPTNFPTSLPTAPAKLPPGAPLSNSPTISPTISPSQSPTSKKLGRRILIA